MAHESRILGPDGQPIRRQELTREIAAPSITGVRQVWDARTVASGLTPERLAALLLHAIQGDHEEYLTLAMEMEERDLHYASVLGTRKLAISGLEPVVEAASDAAADVRIADAVRELVRRPEFGVAVDESLDALGKGFAAVEILWDRSGREWWPHNYLWRDPRHFIFDRHDGRTLRLLDEANSYEGLPLPPAKFITHMPRLRSGLPVRRGFARLAAVAYMCKAYAITDWVAFAEVFGMPLRIGRYGPQATERDIQTLINAVANLGSDAAAVLPDSMRVDFQEAGNRQGAADLFERLATFMDRQLSKAILGQVASTEGTPGKLGGDDAQDEVRRDIQRADAGQLADTLNRDLVRPFVDLNYGPQETYPRVMLPVQEPEDLAALVEALDRLVPLGLGVEASWTRDKFGIPDPQDGAELLAPAASAATPALNREQRTCPGCGTAHNREQPPDTEIERLAEEAESEWEEQLTPVVDPIRELADRAESFDDFLAGLPGLLEEMDSEELVRRLAERTFRARGLGDATDEVE
jgi:phage gp29-like protein